MSSQNLLANLDISVQIIEEQETIGRTAQHNPVRAQQLFFGVKKAVQRQKMAEWVCARAWVWAHCVGVEPQHAIIEGVRSVLNFQRVTDFETLNFNFYKIFKGIWISWKFSEKNAINPKIWYFHLKNMLKKRFLKIFDRTPEL
jgi:hypothetical protein